MYRRVTIHPLERVGMYVVRLDGEPVNGVIKVDVSMEADCLPTVTLTVRAQEVDAELLCCRVETMIEGDENAQ